MRRAGPAALLALALLPGAGCKGRDAAATAGGTGAGGTGAAPVAAPDPADAFKGEVEHARGGWVGTILRTPATFQELAKTSAGWAKLYKGELRPAVESFRESLEELGDAPEAAPARAVLRVGLGRVLFEIADVVATAGDLHVRLLKEYFETRDARRPPGAHVAASEALFHGVALALAGDSAGALTRLGSVAAMGAAAGPWLGQALAWKGLLQEGKDRADTWKLASGHGPETADLVAYLRCRAGEAGPPPEGGSVLRDRLKVAELACRGHAADALALAATGPASDFRTPDQTDRIPALAEVEGAGDVELKYFSPSLLQELGRAWLSEAAAALAGVGGCAAYWHGRVLERAGEPGAVADYRSVGDDKPELDFACTVFSPYQDRGDLQYDGGLRAAGMAPDAKPPDLAAADQRLIRRAWRLGAALADPGREATAAQAMGPLQAIPEDSVPVVQALESGLAKEGAEEGRALATKVRAFELYGAEVIRAKAAVAGRVGEHPAALSLLQASHDNQNTDKVSPLNQSGYLLRLALALWNVKQRRPAVVYMQELSSRFPELWQNVEFMNRVDAIFAVGGGDVPVQGQ